MKRGREEERKEERKKGRKVRKVKEGIGRDLTPCIELRSIKGYVGEGAEQSRDETAVEVNEK